MHAWLTRIIALTLISFPLHSKADDLGFSINNHYLEAKYQNYFGNNFSSQYAWVYANNDEQKTHLISMAFFAYNKSGAVDVYLGAKPYYFDGEKVDGRGIALGGAVNYHFVTKAYLSASAYYAPDILTGGDFENYTDASLSLGYRVLPNADLSLGYRFLEASRERYDYEIYNGMFFNFKINI
jgi:hypothetical protein